MGYSWPTAPDEDGNGSTEDDMRQIVGAQYMNQGILPDGGLSVEGTSSMSYKISAGAAFMWTSESQRKGVLVPVSGVTIPTEAAPSAGSRTDSIYLMRDGIPRVTSSSAPSSSVLLAQFLVPAGTTSTTSAQRRIDREFATPVGANLGRWLWYFHPRGGTGGPGEQVLKAGQFYLPSDRLFKVDLVTTIKSSADPGIAQFDVQFIGGSKRSMLCHHNAEWNTWSTSWNFHSREGLTEVVLSAKAYNGGAWQYASSSEFSTEFVIWDAGVTQ